MKRDTKKYLEGAFRAPRTDLTFGELFTTTIPFLEEIDSPISLGVYMRLKYECFSSYLDMSIRPDDYNNPDDFYLDYQAIKLFSKAEFFPNVYDTKKEAVVSFIEAEEKCRITNNHFISRKGPLWGDSDVRAVFHSAGRKIATILGDCPGITELDFAFGPGNNVGLSRKTSVYDKLNGLLSITSNLLPYAEQLFQSCPAWAVLRSQIGEVPSPEFCGNIELTEVTGSKLGFVPKNAKTDRSICTEPLLNSFVQKGIGTSMRRKLRHAGCNLESQGRNQELARQGSITGKLATIDLKAASDTISYMTVLELLPYQWFHLLDTARCSHYTVGEKAFHFEKFSSMGNAFTFELESLIFLALARATCSHLGIECTDVSVYGDDIIIPVEAVSLFTKLLKFCGFEINEAKSFFSGPFRESCGMDWYLGALVRPVFLKRKPSNEVLIAWCNRIIRLYGYEDTRGAVLYDSLKTLVPSAFHMLKGPDGFGDGHFITRRQQSDWIADSHVGRGWEGFGYYTLGTTPITRTYTDDTVYVAALYESQRAQNLKVSSFPRLRKFVAEKVEDRLGSRFDGKVDPFTQRSSVLLATTRGKVRTTLRRQFHPWS
jgi:hypothetical protein